MSLAESSLRSMRIIHGAMLLAAMMYVVLAFVLKMGAPAKNAPLLWGVVGGVAVGTVIAAYFVRQLLVRPAGALLALEPDNAEAVTRWRTGTVLSLVMCETVVLFGLALKFLGAFIGVSGFFFAIGIVLLIFWTPRIP